MLHPTVVSENDSQEETITNAKAPFDSPDAELIIRSSDTVDFRVFKCYLSLVSSVFKDMLALPQSPICATNDDQEMKDGLPIILVTEGSNIMEKLLMYCYPNILTLPPAPMTVDEMFLLLEAAIKYGIDRLESRLRNTLYSVPKPMVQRAAAMKGFVIAYRQRWEKEMRIAAKHTLTEHVWARLYISELESITGGDLHRLHQYRLECADAANTNGNVV